MAFIIARVSEMMSRWSGMAYGGCRTVRPLEPCGTCRSGCCASGDCIVLHDASDVTEVRIHGEVIPTSQWNFSADRGLLCAIPPLSWPTADPRYEAVGALEVVTYIGAKPDAWAIAVANELACELIKSCAGGKCRLPDKATTVTSLGVTITISDDEIKYALPSVAAWVSAINPANATQPARIFSPESDRARVVGGYMGKRGDFRWH